MSVRLISGPVHPCGQLAERLVQAVQTVYNRLFRIRRLLFDCVERHPPTEVPS